jgi:hypothetical protein
MAGTRKGIAAFSSAEEPLLDVIRYLDGTEETQKYERVGRGKDKRKLSYTRNFKQISRSPDGEREGGAQGLVSNQFSRGKNLEEFLFYLQKILGGSQTWFRKDFLFFIVLYKRLVQYVLPSLSSLPSSVPLFLPSTFLPPFCSFYLFLLLPLTSLSLAWTALNLQRWRWDCEPNSGFLSTKILQAYPALQINLAQKLTKLLNGGNRVPSVRSVLMDVVACSREHLQTILESMEFIVTELPESHWAKNWEELMVCFLTLHTWLLEKFRESIPEKENIRKFNTTIINALAKNPENLMTLARQAEYLNLRIPDIITHTVVDHFKNRRMPLCLPNLRRISRIFISVPPSFSLWILHNSSCAYFSSALPPSFPFLPFPSPSPSPCLAHFL